MINLLSVYDQMKFLIRFLYFIEINEGQNLLFGADCYYKDTIGM